MVLNPRRLEGEIFFHNPERLGWAWPVVEREIRSHALKIHDSSALARDLKYLKDFRALVRGALPMEFYSREQAYAFFITAFGLDFVLSALAHGVKRGVQFPRERWVHLLSGEPNIARRAKSSHARRVLWETVLACAISRFASPPSFEEPDLCGEFRGKTYGVAAKFITSERKLWGVRLKEGLDQAQAIETDFDIVFVNVVDLFDPLMIMTRSELLLDNSGPGVVRWVKDWAFDWCDRPELRAVQRRLESEAKRATAVLFFIPTLVVCNRIPMPFFYVHAPLTMGAIDYEFATEFVRSMHSVPNPDAADITGFGQ